MPPPSLAFIETLAAQPHAQRSDDDPQVESQASVLDVPQVELDPLAPGQRRPAVDLGPSGEARLDREAAALSLGVLLDLDGQRGSRADDRHLAPDYVPQVGQLVKRVPPQELPDSGDPVISFLDGQPGTGELGAGDHRAQLVDLKSGAVSPGASL